ncbi:MAG: DUF4136 domain-containing protein [Planctomycetota bacterium]
MAAPRTVRRLPAAFLVAVLAGCSSSIEVHSSHDPAADFVGLKSYGWLPRRPGQGEEERLAAWVRQAAERELAARGFLPASTGRPDFVVGTQAVVQRRRTVTRVRDEDYDYGRGSLWGESYNPLERTGGSRSYEREESVATLMIDIAHPGSRKPFWRASARTEINPRAPVPGRRDRVREAVHRMLSRFPPD